MAAESKNKKRKAPPVAANTSKKVKQSAPSTTSTKASKKGASSMADVSKPVLDLVSPLIRTSKRKQAADYFDDASSESGDAGWGQFKDPKAAKSKKSKVTKAKLSGSETKLPAVTQISKAIKEASVDISAEIANSPDAESFVSKAALKTSTAAKGETLSKSRKSSKKVIRVPEDATSGSEGERKTRDLHIAPVPKKTKAHSKEEQANVRATDEDVSGDGTDEAETDEDDQTAALLKGFESSDNDDDDSSQGDSLNGQAVPVLPNEKKVRKKLKDASRNGHDGPGVVYVGRIPHGFYEREMRAYFTQFGEILRLRLSRNRKTGRSKHYAFIEFASSEVARIVAETMDNYLMFGHILKCKQVSQEQVHVSLWKGANRRFKTIPRNKIEGRKLEMVIGKETWDKKIDLETKRREEKAAKLKAIGYEFSAPTLKRADDIQRKGETTLVVGGSDGEITREETLVIEKDARNTVVVVAESSVGKARPAVKSRNLTDSTATEDSIKQARRRKLQSKAIKPKKT